MREAAEIQISMRNLRWRRNHSTLKTSSSEKSKMLLLQSVSICVLRGKPPSPNTHTFRGSCLYSLMRIRKIWHNFLLKHNFCNNASGTICPIQRKKEEKKNKTINQNYKYIAKYIIKCCLRKKYDTNSLQMYYDSLYIPVSMFSYCIYIYFFNII